MTVHPVARSSPWTGNPIVYPEDAPEVEANRKAAEAAVNTAATKLGTKPPSVTVRSVNGVPAQELINASADADLVVVSSRGGGGFPGLKMGSVSSQVASHAECPVVVIR